MIVLVTAPNMPSKVLNTGNAVAMPYATVTIATFCKTKRVYVSSCAPKKMDEIVVEPCKCSLAIHAACLLGEQQTVHRLPAGKYDDCIVV